MASSNSDQRKKLVVIWHENPAALLPENTYEELATNPHVVFMEQDALPKEVDDTDYMPLFTEKIYRSTRLKPANGIVLSLIARKEMVKAEAFVDLDGLVRKLLSDLKKIEEEETEQSVN